MYISPLVHFRPAAQAPPSPRPSNVARVSVSPLRPSRSSAASGCRSRRLFTLRIRAGAHVVRLVEPAADAPRKAVRVAGACTLIFMSAKRPAVRTLILIARRRRACRVCAHRGVDVDVDAYMASRTGPGSYIDLHGCRRASRICAHRGVDVGTSVCMASRAGRPFVH